MFCLLWRFYLILGPNGPYLNRKTQKGEGHMPIVGRFASLSRGQTFIFPSLTFLAVGGNGWMWHVPCSCEMGSDWS